MTRLLLRAVGRAAAWVAESLLDAAGWPDPFLSKEKK